MNTENEIAWAKTINEIKEDSYLVPLLPIAIAASQDQVLQQLFPVISHLRLWFSKTPQYPFSPLEGAVAFENGAFVVYDRSFQVLAKTKDAGEIIKVFRGLSRP